MGSIEPRVVQQLAKQFGIETTRLNRKIAQVAGFLLSRKVSLVLDVGANVGQYGKELRARGYRGRIVSFEPVSGFHATLKKNAAGDSAWIVAPRTAVGSEEGIVSIGVAANSALRPMLHRKNRFSRIDANAAIARTEQVPLVTLNSLARQFTKSGDVMFLKIDSHGFEYEVLDGADKMLNGLCGVQLQLSLAPPYQGERSFRFMTDFMESKGFELQSLASAFADGTADREIQVDAVFVRGGTAWHLAHWRENPKMLESRMNLRTA